ncbi:MAG TPA: transglutaminase family protein [Caulobacteraceae bacterium]|nr:transglutaminase family protein [Caulobacteraceae bacterium]
MLQIRHRTRYRYRRGVSFGEHRMMLRPREGPDQAIVEERLEIRPEPALVRTLTDVFGNTVRLVRFGDVRARELVVESLVSLRHDPDANSIEAEETFPPRGAPFEYPPDDVADLTRALTPLGADPEGAVGTWAARFAPANGRGRVIEALTAMAEAIGDEFRYETRLLHAARPAARTLDLRSGSCRDFAVLMMDAARRLGLAARFASGYLLVETNERGGGHTHAWTQVFLPSCGWIDFDPTNAAVGSARLVRVASTLEHWQASPLHGVWNGSAGDYLGMEVDIDVAIDRRRRSEPRRLRSVGLARAG